MVEIWCGRILRDAKERWVKTMAILQTSTSFLPALGRRKSLLAGDNVGDTRGLRHLGVEPKRSMQRRQRRRRGQVMNELIEITNGGAFDSATETIYAALAKHQRDEMWDGQEMLVGLHTWAARFIVEFKLDISDITLCVDRLGTGRYGHFRRGHNGFGLRGEIAINTRYLSGQRQVWQVLGTLLHELLHAWQETHGTPGTRNHHNAEIQAKALELGLNIDKRGATGFAANSPFKELLRKFGVSVPDHEVPIPKERPRGDSKMKKWSCGCTTVRVAIADFRARCLKLGCGNEFQRDGPPAKPEGNANHAE